MLILSKQTQQHSLMTRTRFAQNDRLKAILGEDGEEKLSVYEQISEALDDYGIECEMSEVPEKLGELVRLQPMLAVFWCLQAEVETPALHSLSAVVPTWPSWSSS